MLVLVWLDKRLAKGKVCSPPSAPRSPTPCCHCYCCHRRCCCHCHCHCCCCTFPTSRASPKACLCPSVPCRLTHHDPAQGSRASLIRGEVVDHKDGSYGCSFIVDRSGEHTLQLVLKAGGHLNPILTAPLLILGGPPLPSPLQGGGPGPAGWGRRGVRPSSAATQCEWLAGTLSL